MEKTCMVSASENIGQRLVANNLILINQEKKHAWISGGLAPDVWALVKKGRSREEIVHELSSLGRAPYSEIERTVGGLLREFWLRGLLRLNGQAPSHAEIEAAQLPEPHNISGYLLTVAVATETINRCTFDLLVPCNLRCRHCYLDFSRKEIMPLAKASDYFTQLAELGCVEISLTGGEIFLRKDLMEVVDAAISRGFLADLLTNGMFIDDKAADAIAARRIKEVQISIYGSTAEIHERTTKTSGSFNKSIGAVKRLVERGVGVRLAFMVQKDNFEDAFRFSEFAESLGARAQFDSKLVPTRDGKMDPLDYGIGVHQLSALYAAGVIKKELGYECSAAVSKLRITSDGEVFPCEIINNASMGNLNDTTLAEMWASNRRKKLRADILGFKPQRCGGCSQTAECEPCAAMRGFGYDKAEEAEISEACLMTTAGVLATSTNLRSRERSLAHLSSVVEREAAAYARTEFASSLVQIMGVRIAH